MHMFCFELTKFIPGLGSNFPQKPFFLSYYQQLISICLGQGREDSVPEGDLLLLPEITFP